MTVYQSRFTPVTIPNLSITAFVLRHAERLAKKPAIIEGASGRKLTYGDLRQQILTLAGGLAARGVGKGTTVGLMSTNQPEFAVVFHALASLGATVTTLNPTYRAPELAIQLRDSGASWMFTGAPFAEVAAEACEVTNIVHRVLLGPGADGWVGLESLLGEPIEAPVEVNAAEDVVVLPYSSGTTGFPKGVMLTHHNLVANLCQIEPVIRIAEDETIFAVLPFFTSTG